MLWAAALLCLAACAGVPAPQAASLPLPPPTPAQPFRWSDAVLYFVIVDRFADGDPSNNVAVDEDAKGAFHGGDLDGLRQQLDEIATLGVNALWIRLDTVKHVDHPFWNEHRQRTHALAEDFFLLGEVWGGDSQVLDPWFAGDEMDAGFDFSFQGSVLGFVQGRGRTVAFDRYLKSREKTRPGYLLAHFLSSHDVPTALHQLGGDRELFRLAAILHFTSIGIPVIYYGEEVGRVGGDWPENRSDMPWGERPVEPGAGRPRDESLRGDYSRLIAIRRAHPALSRGSHSAISTDGDLLVFSQKQAGDIVVVAVNRSTEPTLARFTLPSEWHGSKVIDAWNQEAVAVTAGMIESAVLPRSARIFVVQTGVADG